MGDLSETIVTATSDYLHLPMKQAKQTKSISIYSKYTA